MTEKNTYDETPYHSYPYAQSSPEKLATLGILFGMTPPDIKTARVLELGCASGGNIIPHAAQYPKGQYVGVDLSKVQIDDGIESIKSLGLKNITLRHCSIEDIDESFGEFDYIVCHGVLSWVPENVRSKIFEITNKNLSKNGIAYISYNTLPGWNMIRTIRDMMLYHANGFSNANEKVAQSRALLNFVKESLEGSETPYAKILTQEATLLAKQGDHYLRHDHLEDENKQYYFNEFISHAQENNLQYLSDTSLSSMYLGNMGEKVSQKLGELNDIVRTEQYMDFITNRRFRSTLLCHKDVKLNRALNSADAKKFSLALDVTTKDSITQQQMESKDEIKFYFHNSEEQYIATTSPYLKAALMTFMENKGGALKFDTLVKKVNKKFTANCKEHIEQELLNNAMNLVIKGYMSITLFERDISKIKIDKPSLNKFAAHQADNIDVTWVTNLSHSPVALDTFEKFVVKHINGKHNKQKILELLLKDINNGSLTISRDNNVLTDVNEIQKDLVNYLDNTINKFAHATILE